MANSFGECPKVRQAIERIEKEPVVNVQILVHENVPHADSLSEPICQVIWQDVLSSKHRKQSA